VRQLQLNRTSQALTTLQAAALASWLGFAAMLLAARAPASTGRLAGWWCMPGMTSTPRGGAGPLASALAGMPMWCVMVLAMTVPSAIPAAGHVSLNSLRPRAGRAVAEFVLVFLALWIAFGLLAMSALALLPALPRYLPLAACLLLASAWELTAVKRHAIDRCHRGSPLPPSGPRATLGVARFAWLNGSACIASCWPAMLAMLLVPSSRLAWALGLTALMSYEKLTRKPRTASRRAAGLLAAAAAGVALALLV